MSRTLLPLRLEKVWVAIESMQASEVLGPRAWVPIPGARPEFPGVIAWRGRAIAVIDLGALTGICTPAGEGVVRERTVVVQVGALTFALPVDAVREVEIVPDEKVRRLTAAGQRFAVCEIDIAGLPAPVLELTAVVGALTSRAAKVKNE